MSLSDDLGLDDTDDEPDREDGRNPGQGWWLEEQTRDAILDLDSVDVDEIALNVSIAALETDIAVKTPINRRWVVQCKDWQAGTITPHDIFRLATVATRANANPLLVHIEDTDITDRAELLCKELSIPRCTLSDLQNELEYLPKDNYKECERSIRLGVSTPQDKKWSDLPDIFQPIGVNKTKTRDEKAHYISRKPGPVS